MITIFPSSSVISTLAHDFRPSLSRKKDGILTNTFPFSVLYTFLVTIGYTLVIRILIASGYILVIHD